MKDNLKSYLERLREGRPELHFALLTPCLQASPPWLLEWSSNGDGMEMPFLVGSLSPSLDSIPNVEQTVTLGTVLESHWERLGLLVWSASVMTPRREMSQVLESSRLLYWELVERRWSSTVTTLLDALQEQRKEIGAAIHRGPAQSMTAARLELSLLGNPSLAVGRVGSVSKALEQASEELIALVHGKLRERTTKGGLLEALRAELRFQARWRGLESEGTSVVLPSESLAVTLADLWVAVGGKIRRSGSVIGFDEAATSS